MQNSMVHKPVHVHDAFVLHQCFQDAAPSHPRQEKVNFASSPTAGQALYNDRAVLK